MAVEGTWVCGRCGGTNWDADDMCRTCRLPRSVAAPTARREIHRVGGAPAHDGPESGPGVIDSARGTRGRRPGGAAVVLAAVVVLLVAVLAVVVLRGGDEEVPTPRAGGSGEPDPGCDPWPADVVGDGSHVVEGPGVHVYAVASGIRVVSTWQSDVEVTAVADGGFLTLDLNGQEVGRPDAMITRTSSAGLGDVLTFETPCEVRSVSVSVDSPSDPLDPSDVKLGTSETAESTTLELARQP